MKTKLSIWFAIVVLSSITLFAAEKPKNIILLIGDGMSTPQRMTAEEFARKAKLPPLAMNALPYQATTRTCSADSLVTDSAAAATAIACGVKTYNHAMGVDANGRPAESCAEVAKAAGKKVGIITSVTINHATPSGFYAHRKDRGMCYEMGLDLVDSNFDLFAGGGVSRHDDKKNKLYRGSIYDLAAEVGYKVIRGDRAAFDRLRPGCGKVLYAAADDTLPNAIDIDQWKNIPTLAEITKKALELLGDSKKGFFLMVEGGKIDYSGHANDAAVNLRETLAFDDAVKVALEFQKKHPDTLVITTGDHETGGMTMGFAAVGYAFYMDRLANQKCSAERIKDYMREKQPQNLDDLKPYLTKNFGFKFTDDRKDPMRVNSAERKEIAEALAFDLELARKGKKDDEAYDAAKVSRLPSVIKSIISHKCGIGWTSGGHTALPVLTTAKGPGGNRFVGLLDNTDIAKIIKEFVR